MSLRRIDLVFILILLAALYLRLHLASTLGLIHDEENTSIPLSQTISFAPDHLHLPIRAVNHPALPAYFVKLGSTLFGATPAGYRSAHVVAGMCAIVLIYFLTRQRYGPSAARWAAALLAFNEYFLVISSRATAHLPYLFFVAVALYASSRFLAVQRPTYLYGTAAALALAFYCKEHTVLLLPGFALMLLRGKYRTWWRRPHIYVAAVLFGLLISPDVLWNLRSNPDTARITFGSREVQQATYASHLRRIGGIGLSEYPLVFYGRSAVRAAHARITGEELDDNTPEYHSMNSAIGALLLVAVLAMTFRRVHQDDLRSFLLTLFWIVFGFFTLIRKGDSPGLDPVSWVWVDVTMLPAVILAGAWLARAGTAQRIVSWTFAGGALLYAGARMASQ